VLVRASQTSEKLGQVGDELFMISSRLQDMGRSKAQQSPSTALLRELATGACCLRLAAAASLLPSVTSSPLRSTNMRLRLLEHWRDSHSSCQSSCCDSSLGCLQMSASPAHLPWLNCPMLLTCCLLLLQVMDLQLHGWKLLMLGLAMMPR
jgi:hypothetical protein